jgi:hypothetical protein
VRAMRRWSEAEYEVLFRNHPPNDHRAPDLAECRTIARAVRRTPDAVLSQWNDARSIVLGHTHDASRLLADYVRRRGWM